MRLRSDILWAGKRYGAAAEQLELMYADRWRDFESLREQRLGCDAAHDAAERELRSVV